MYNLLDCVHLRNYCWIGIKDTKSETKGKKWTRTVKSESREITDEMGINAFYARTSHPYSKGRRANLLARD